jgi:hypothetical protein
MPPTFTRRIYLSETGNPTAKPVIRLLSAEVSLPDAGIKKSWVTITRTGQFTHPKYGAFSITREMLLAMVANFNSRVLGIDIFMDVEHEPEEGAAGKILELAVEGNRLRGLVEWTDLGIDAVRNKLQCYVSAEYCEDYVDNEQGQHHGPVLLGAGLTLRPVIKGMEPVLLSESAGSVPMFLHPALAVTLSQKSKDTMNKHIKALLARLQAKKLSESSISAVIALAEQSISHLEPTDDTQIEGILANFEAMAIQLSETGQKPQETIQLSEKQISDMVNRTLAQRDENNRKLAETRTAKVKLLSDTINAAEGLDDDTKRQLSENASALVTSEMGDDQIKALAQLQIDNANKLAAAKKLSSMGWPGTGSPRITIVGDDHIKLSGIYHDNLRMAGTGALRLLSDANLPPFAKKVLSEFDRLQGAAIQREVKMLSGGAMDMGSTALPVGVQREVIREALSDLNILQLVQQLTDFGAVEETQIPYEARDISAAVGDGIVYEGQPIPNAGISQRMWNARITPMKLAMSITEEVRYLTSASALNWDAMRRNIESNARILRELVARRVANELQRAADSYGALPVVAESFTAQLNGSKSMIKTTAFPIVRPFQARNLQGVTVGSAENQITVTLNSSVISMWNGTGTQSAGTYWRLVSVNLGTIQFVDQSGAPVTPANAGTNTISYSRATNCTVFDIDVPSGAEKAKHMNGLIEKIGAQKAMMSGQRFVSPNYLLMSPALNDICTNAEQFSAMSKRDGSNTDAMGDLQGIKGIQAWGTNAPGIDLGDERIIIGERGAGGYAVVKPYQMGELVQKQVNGSLVGTWMASGTEFNAIAVPPVVRNRMTSVVVYSATARAAI